MTMILHFIINYHPEWIFFSRICRGFCRAFDVSLSSPMLYFYRSWSIKELCLADNFPANFVFGDSLVEVGNNNYIVSLSKANFIPNGIDFGKPTGRYTNGRTIVDIVGQEIGLKHFTPPYLDPTTTGPVVLQGVSYASGGGGILNHTGKIFGGRINLDAQMDNFANTRQDIISSIGSPAAIKLFNRALYSVTMGSNDFINNYLVPVLSTVEQKLISPQMFVDTLISKFRLQLTRLYNMGARKIIVVNVGPIGCIPYQREINPSAGENCVAFPNELAQMFNAPLKDLVAELSENLKGATFIYADVYRIVDDIVKNYKSYGFEIANSACCAVAGKFGGLIPCGPKSKVCLDRSKYVFWDPYHPPNQTIHPIKPSFRPARRPRPHHLALRPLQYHPHLRRAYPRLGYCQLLSTLQAAAHGSAASGMGKLQYFA